MTVSGRKALVPGDIMLLCTDGVWANLRDVDIAAFYSAQPNGAAEGANLRAALEQLGQRAVQASAPYSDNSTAAVLRWLGP
jgi:protein phosphatase